MKHRRPPPDPTNDLRGYLNIVRRRKWSIGLIALLVTGGAVFASLRQTPMYDSTAEVQVDRRTTRDRPCRALRLRLLAEHAERGGGGFDAAGR